MDFEAARCYQRFLVPVLFQPWAARLVERAMLSPSSRVLDLACGTGVIAKNWLISSSAVDRFFEELNRCPSLKPLMGIPLLATLTAAVYTKQQQLPANKTGLYSLFIELLCGGWDMLKGVNRQGKFGLVEKQIVLTRLAGVNHRNRRRDASEKEIRQAVLETLTALESHLEDLVGEFIQDGLVVSTGSGVRFGHLSFQEYLAAVDLADPQGVWPQKGITEVPDRRRLVGRSPWLLSDTFWEAYSCQLRSAGLLCADC